MPRTYVTHDPEFATLRGMKLDDLLILILAQIELSEWQQPSEIGDAIAAHTAYTRRQVMAKMRSVNKTGWDGRRVTQNDIRKNPQTGRNGLIWYSRSHVLSTVSGQMGFCLGSSPVGRGILATFYHRLPPPWGKRPVDPTEPPPWKKPRESSDLEAILGDEGITW